MSKNKQNKGTETTLAMVGQDANVFSYLEEVKTKLAEVQKITDSVYRTPGRITMGNGGTVDIKEEQNIEKLVTAYANVKFKIQSLDEAYDDLGFSSRKVSKVDGGTIEDWKADFILRINIINNQEKLNKLNKIKDGLTSLMDNNQKAALLMEDLKNI